MSKVVSLPDFWDLMCDPKFIRTDRYHGRIMNVTYYCPIPPESVEGFINSKIIETINLLFGQLVV